MIRLALFLLAVLAALPASAQTGPLGDALQTLARERGLRLVYEGSLVAGVQTTCPRAQRGADRSAESVLACLLRGTRIESRRLASGTIALYRAERPTPAPRDPEPQAPEPPPTATLSGTVVDAETGETLIGAAVYVPALGRGATTNAYGFYSLPLPAGTAQVTARYVGLVPVDTTVRATRDQRLDFALSPVQGGLGEVVIEAAEGMAGRAHPSVSLSGEDIQAAPAALGEADLLKVLQLEPGVSTGVPGTAGLHVRGGTPDQTLLLLDGIPVYNASHLFGLLSTFNAEAVKHVELFKGGFPARYGGRLSSVVDVRMREGNRREREGHARIGVLSGQAIVEGPVAGADASYMVAARRTYLDILAAPVLAATGGIDGVTPTAHFYDLNAKANWRPSSRDGLYLSLYTGRDRFAGSGDEDDPGAEASGFVNWGNTTGALRWTRLLSDRLFAATTLTASDYTFQAGTEAVRLDPITDSTRRFGARYLSGIRDLAVHTDLDWTPAPNHTVRVGASASRHRYAPGLFLYEPGGAAPDTTLGASRVGSWEGAVYAEDEVQIGRAFLSAGVRASGYAVGGETYGALEPRLAARLDVRDGLAVRASVSRMTQYLHLLTTVGGLGLPADLWVPATERVPPGRAWHGSVGVADEAGATRWSADVFAKSLSGLVTYREDAGLVRADADWQDEVTTGSGRAYGLELALSHAGPRTSGRVAYTLSRADRQFDAIDGGERFPYRYDRTHDLALGVRHRLSDRVDVSATFVYQTGPAVTLPTVAYLTPQPGIDLSNEVLPATGAVSVPAYAYSGRNAYRLPATNRLDLGLDLYFRRGPRPHALSFSLYNATARPNPYYAEVEGRLDESGEFRPMLVGKGLLPLLPSVSYEFSF